MLYVSVPVWQLHTNIPSRTVRLVRHHDDIQEFFIQDILAGTWRMTNPTIMELLYTSSGWARYYDNLPGTNSWVRRSDTDEEGWSVFMIPLLEQYPGDMMRPTQAGIQVPIITVRPRTDLALANALNLEPTSATDASEPDTASAATRTSTWAPRLADAAAAAAQA